MKTVDFSVVFPKRVNISAYLPIVEAALESKTGKDGNAQVVVEEYGSPQLAVKAANAIRLHSQKNHLALCVSCPKDSKSIFVYKGTPRKRTPKKSNDADAA
jgi:hypothetical protein